MDEDVNERQPGRDERAVYIISVAAELAGVHPQTLRIYERKGLVQPKRTSGNTRRYSDRDIELLQQIQDLTQHGINLAGAKLIIEMQRELEDLHRRVEQLQAELRASRRFRRAAEDTRFGSADLVPLRNVVPPPWEEEEARP
jgi:MerR family transcriptional regulator/heat shock protein HspR